MQSLHISLIINDFLEIEIIVQKARVQDHLT